MQANNKVNFLRAEIEARRDELQLMRSTNNELLKRIAEKDA